MSATEFVFDINVFQSEGIPKEVVRLQKKITEYAFRRFYQITPYDTKETKKCWKVSSKRPTTDAEPSSSPIGDAMDEIRKIAPYDTVYIVNNNPVAEILDKGLFDPPDPGPSQDPRPERHGRILVKDGYSTQAPLGMTAIVEAEVDSIF